MVSLSNHELSPVERDLLAWKLVRVVGEERVDAERVEEMRHLVADAGEAGLFVRAKGPRRHGQAGGVRALHELGMTRDDEFLGSNAGRELCQLADARLRDILVA